MAEYLTHTGLTLKWEQDEEKLHLVTLNGDRQKVLFHGANMGEAAKVYRDTKAHYEKRKADELG